MLGFSGSVLKNYEYHLVGANGDGTGAGMGHKLLGLGRRKQILLTSFFLTIFIFYSDNIYNTIILPPTNLHHRFFATTDEGYLVSTSGCRLLSMDPFHADVKPYIEKSYLAPCKAPLVVLYNDGRLVFDASKNKSWKAKGTTCCYRVIHRVTQDPKNYTVDADYLVKEEKECHKIPRGPQGVLVKDQYLKVECINDKKVKMFEDFYGFAVSPRLLNNDTNAKVDKWTKTKDMDKLNATTTAQPQIPPSIIFIGIDSISRLHMMRSLPSTKEFLEANDFIEMKGYTKIGDNTFPNIMAGFAGLKPEEHSSCWASKTTLVDNCPFIWKNFSDLGYLTAHVEDAPGLAIFNYDKTGFVRPPTDYYLRPIMVAEQKHLKMPKYGGSTRCLGGGLTPTQVLLKYISQFISLEENKVPKFLLSWFTSVGHDDFNGLKSRDGEFRSLLENVLKKVGDNSVLFFISDHGYRFGAFRETFLGFYEESLPFFYVRLSPSMKYQFPQWYEALKINQNRLTSPHDLHSALVDLYYIAKERSSHYNSTFDLENITIDPKNSSTISKTMDKEGGKLRQLSPSLFDVGPLNRTCESSFIPQKYCICGVSPVMSSKSKQAQELADFILAKINEDLKVLIKKKTCVTLKSTKVLYGRSVGSGDVWNNFGKLEPYNDYLLALDTTPGNGKFEARLRLFKNSTKLLLGDVSRINSYQGKSDCIQDYKLKNFCMCQSILDKEALEEKKKKEALQKKKKKKKDKKKT